TIIGQATRIHLALTDLMQFARPPAPKRQPVDAAALLRDVVETLRDHAAQRRVRLVCIAPAVPVTLDADPAQARTALRCVLCNAVEAAPPAAVSVTLPADGGEPPPTRNGSNGCHVPAALP